jgi:hypothetical protein
VREFRFLSLTDRHGAAQGPANNLALAPALSGHGLINALMPLTLVGLAYALQLWR